MRILDEQERQTAEALVRDPTAEGSLRDMPGASSAPQSGALATSRVSRAVSTPDVQAWHWHVVNLPLTAPHITYQGEEWPARRHAILDLAKLLRDRGETDVAHEAYRIALEPGDLTSVQMEHLHDLLYEHGSGLGAHSAYLRALRPPRYSDYILLADLLTTRALREDEDVPETSSADEPIGEISGDD